MVGVLVLAGCGGGLGAPEIEDGEWRPKMKGQVEFPLPQRITLTVGIPGEVPSSDRYSLQWLEEETNIHLEFASLPGGQAGLIDLGIMIRERRVPDFIPDHLLREDDFSLRASFIDLREFPSLTPTFNALLGEDEGFARGVSSQFRFEGGLFSLGSYNRDAVPYLGCLAYRKDTFDALNLGFGTFEELGRSLAALKQEYPESSPLGLSAESVLSMFPSLFGSGYDRRLVAYHHPTTHEWTMGVREPSFREAVVYLAELHADGLVNPEFLIATDRDLGALMVNDRAFVTATRFRTGPRFSPRISAYGDLTETGEWNGEGMWVAAMPPPATSTGATGWISSTHWPTVGGGWNVYKLSEHPAEAVALLDFFFSEEAAMSAHLGPEGEVWESLDGKVSLSSIIRTPQNPEGVMSYDEYFKERGVQLGFSLGGLRPNVEALVGRDSPALRYARRYEYDPYFGSGAVITSPSPVLSSENDFWSDVSSLAVGLQSIIGQRVFEFITGVEPLDEYEDFVAEVRKLGGDKLVDLLRQNSRLPDMDEILARD